jgi:cytochrome c oxidase assembly factor CtaG
MSAAQPRDRRVVIVGAAAAAGLVVIAAGLGGRWWAQTRAGGLPVVWCRWHPGETVLPPLTGARLLTSWQLDPVALLALAPVAAGYGWAARRVRRRHPTRPWPKARTAAFSAGLGVIAAATSSSIGVYDMTLFTVHMAQHLALIMVAPPLLAAGRPLTLALHATRNPWHTRIKRAARSRPVSVITYPPVAYAVYAVTIVGTHLSGVMDQVMQRPWLGQAEHLLYLGAGYLFFVLVFGDEPIRWRMAMPGRFALVVLSMAVDTFVGIVLMQGTRPITMLPHPGWGASALTDTQTGGAIMWFFGDGIMAVLIVLIFLTWVRRPEYARRTSHSWLERARQGTFATHTGQETPSGPPTGDLDDDPTALEAYNAWLAQLARQER